jgi:GR25 family glycosyltransferase involved in LPS biosynthesis
LRHEIRQVFFWLAFLRLQIGRRASQGTHPTSSWQENIDVVVINLAHREDRLTEIARQLSRIGIEHYEVLNAFDGRKLYAGEEWLAGKWGCAMSHHSALMDRKLSARPLLVIEDDLVFVDSPTTLRDAVAAFLADDRLDLMTLDWSTVRKKKISDKFYFVTDSVLTSAYLVKPRGFKYLLRAFSRSIRKLERGKNLPIDHAWWRPQRWNLSSVAPIVKLCRQASGPSDTEFGFVSR